MKRRDLLLGAGALASTALLWPRRAGAAFGSLNPRTNPWGPGIGSRPTTRILEVFLYGGLSPWETFYVRPGTPGAGCTSACPSSPNVSGSQWEVFRCQFEALASHDANRRDASGTPLPITKAFSGGIHLGPATYPLWRDDLFEHLQILVTQHDLLPHEAAIPYTLSGTRLGRPTLVGTGAVVSKAFARPGLDVPTAFVVRPSGDVAGDNLLAATATGTLGSAYKPLEIAVPCGGPDLSVLDREPTPEQDQLLRFYLQQYKQRLTWPGRSGPTRSGALNDYEATVGQFFNTPQIRRLLSDYDRTSTGLIAGTESACAASGSPRCSEPSLAQDAVRQSLNMAAYLLRQPETRYVCVVDVGRIMAGGAGYDTHGDHATKLYRNLTSTLEVIARMTDPSAPGGPAIDPFTMVVLTTEFGRTPGIEGSNGRGHYPYAYTNVIIPPRGIGSAPLARPGKRILGSITPSTDANPGRAAGEAITPTDLRAAMLMALGIDPLVTPGPGDTGSVFGVGDVSAFLQGTDGEESTVRRNLVQKVLGYAV